MQSLLQNPTRVDQKMLLDEMHLPELQMLFAILMLQMSSKVWAGLTELHCADATALAHFCILEDGGMSHMAYQLHVKLKVQLPRFCNRVLHMMMKCPTQAQMPQASHVLYCKTSPVGLCMRSMAVSTLFTFCPPAPPDRAVERSMSLGSILTSTSSTSGMMATVAVDVWTRPWDSVAGTL